MLNVPELVERLNDLRVADLVTLTKRLEDEWGVSAIAVSPAPGLVPGTDGDQPDPPMEEQTEFAVMLESYGDHKLNVIKVVRELRPLDLKAAKALVDSAPVQILEGLSKEQANEAAGKLNREGATARVQ